jgi:energy-coupling factor transporter ATP-binding protein EcfA2
MYYYSLFGWNVASEFELPELFEGNKRQEIDIHIIAKKVDEDLAGATKKGIGFQVKPGHYQLNIEGVARFYVIEGKEIRIDIEKEVDFREVKVYLFASVIGGLCHLRNTLPIHASAVAFRGNSFLFAGNSGSGKSTLVAALQQEGLLALNDDLSPIMFEKDRAVLKQGVARMKLWPDALEWLGKTPYEKDQIRDDLEKYAHQIDTSETTKGFPVKSMFILCPNIYDETLTIKKIEGKEKLVKLMRQTYRTQLIDGLGLEQEHFKKCAQLSQQIEIFEVQQPRTVSRFQDQLELITQQLNL